MPARALALVFFLSLCGAPALGALIRVSPHGPVKSVRKALKQARAGDVVEIMTGRYVEGQIVISHGGRKGAPITVRAGKGQKPVIDAGSVTDAKIDKALYFYRPAGKDVGWWVLEDIEIVGGYTYCLMVDMSNMVFRRCKFHDSGRDCVKGGHLTENVLFEDCEIYNSGKRDPSNAEGLDFVGSVNVTVRNCHIHDIPTCGLYAKGAAKNPVFEGNLIERVGHQAMCLGQSTGIKWMRGHKYECYNGIMRNNLIVNCGSGGLMIGSSIGSRVYNNTLYEPALKSGGGIYIVNTARTRAKNKDFTFRNNVIYSSSKRWFVVLGRDATDPAGKRIIDNNLYFHPGGPGEVKVMCEDKSFATAFYGTFKRYQRWGFDARTIIADPRFRNPAQGDFRLTAGSPAIDRGFAVPGLRSDLQGKPRPLGAAVDLGAYEFGKPPDGASKPWGKFKVQSEDE